MLAQRRGGIDQLQSGLGRERHLGSASIFTILLKPSMSTMVPVDEAQGVSEW